MPDIAICNNDTCEKASDCWRFMAVPSQNQCYIEFKNICRNPTFLWFYPIDDKEIRKEKFEDV